MPKLSVVIPIYNEVNTVLVVVRKVLSVPVDLEVIAVDDGSTDGSRRLLKSFVSDRVRVFYNEKNLGKGSALSKGIREARGDIVAVQDADLEYDPMDLLKMISVMDDEGCSVVYGSRFMYGNAGSSLILYYGNRLLTAAANVLYRANMTDMETCYKLFRREIVYDLSIRSKRFGVDPELTAFFLNKKLDIHDVPISYHPRTKADGKKVRLWDGLVVLATLFRFRFFRWLD
ncbi:MAG: glycosyltransferase family 2 protein [Deferrisomatales bacterium]|nr:glycosyltransferase family 2 protein [Deferrisomatales bacterium]